MSTPLMPVDQALAAILSRLEPRAQAVLKPLSDVLGTVLAEEVKANIDVPAYDNSAMDGYAVNTADLHGELPRLRVSQRIVAGLPGVALAAGTAARIFTGAPIPEGADAVVIQEDTQAEGDNVTLLAKPASGENVRRRGHDIRRGERVLEAGHILRPQDIGLLASLGISAVRVRKPLKVAVINTGDEVISPGQALKPGQLYDSNSFTLEGLLHGAGMPALRMGIVEDDPASTERALAQAAGMADCIITTGGVSVGEEDHVRTAVEKLGELSLWKLAIKPGKPFSFGHVGDTPFFGLPGNPVAVFVTFAIVVRPCLMKLQGARPRDLPVFPVRAGFAVESPGGRQEYLRVRLERGEDGGKVLRAFSDQGSSLLSSLSWADGLAVLPAGATVAEGDLLDYLPFRGLIR